MSEAEKRNVEIKLRVSESEREQIEKIALPNEPLAPVLRGYLLALSCASEGTLRQLRDDAVGRPEIVKFHEDRAVKKSATRVPYPSIDPALLRALTSIGNNVQQIARTCRTQSLSTKDLMTIAGELSHISATLEALRLNNIKKPKPEPEPEPEPESFMPR